CARVYSNYALNHYFDYW
nr:immunoglobulin heavy chain junction region [Macaca mulatta]MOV50221.1 immunoglobulin heavy chain junction region [Macaca mulatta]MOV50619.1 immunoglobulin heavy chain junction region [Macaca mulatta]MOV50635.1 immunoglobulin heavy chain junction region [Macaca mulatta]MOV50716.1 immunoglobulin heavy chain junction region [Macaca mulatta]